MLRLGYDGMLVKQTNFGVGRCILQLGGALLGAVSDSARIGEIVFYVSEARVSGGSGSSAKSPPWSEALQRSPSDSCECRLVSSPPWARTRATRVLWQQLCMPGRARADGLDVFHATGYVMPLRMRVPTVLSVFDLLALDRPELCKPSNRHHYRWFLPASIRRARCIITPSALVRSQIIERFAIAEERVAVVPPGVDEQFRRAADPSELDRLRRRYRLPEHFVLFAGQREPKKNLARLIDAFQQARRAGLEGELLLVGGRGWGPGADRVGQQSGSGSGSGVRQLGHVSESELAGLYRLASEFAFPSLAEGFGLPPLEAMASGTVVVCSEVPSVVESDRDAAVIVDPLSVDSIARGLMRARGDTALRKRLRERGLRAASRYSWQRAAVETLEIYQRALG